MKRLKRMANVNMYYGTSFAKIKDIINNGLKPSSMGCIFLAKSTNKAFEDAAKNVTTSTAGIPIAILVFDIDENNLISDKSEITDEKVATVNDPNQVMYEGILNSNQIVEIQLFNSYNRNYIASATIQNYEQIYNNHKLEFEQ